MEKTTITYNGKDFGCRLIDLSEEFGTHPAKTLVVPVDLWKELMDDYTNGDDEANRIDDEVFFYCDEGYLETDPTDDELRQYLKENVI